MESGGLLPHSEQPAICRYPEPEQSNPCHPPYILETGINITLPLKPMSSIWSPSLRSPTKTLYAILLSPMRATCPVHLIILDFITRIIFGEEYRSLRSSLRSVLHSTVISYVLRPNILLSNLISDTLSLCSFLSVSDQASYPHKTIGKFQFCVSLSYIF